MKIDYPALAAGFVQQNPAVVEAHVDDPTNPKQFHITHRKSFNLYRCKMGWELASLRLVFHPAPLRATKPRL